MYHIPVLLKESIDGLNIRAGGVYVDVTFGSGGHTREILNHLEGGRVIAFDRDPDAQMNIPADERFQLIRQNYRYLKNFLGFQGIKKISGLIADLGISSWQIDQADRGFSTRHDGRLDMRMDREQLQDAVSILNSYTPERLTQILRQYGEIENARRLAAELVSTRQALPITTTAGLKEIATRFAPRGKENQYLARVFQALRIEVNEELDSLREMLLQAADLLETGGRISVISPKACHVC